MPANTRKDPLTTFLFGLKIPSLGMDFEGGTAFFKTVSGLKVETEVTEYREGGVNYTTRKLIGGTKWPNLVLKQGFTGDGLALWHWKMSLSRLDGSVVMLGPDLAKICEWKFINGWPVKWEGPELEASKNELAIETIEIAHEGLELGPYGSQGKGALPGAPESV